MTDIRKRLLVVDDDAEYLTALERALSSDFVVITAGSIVEAHSKLGSGINVALIDIRLRQGREDRGGLDLLESMSISYPDIPVVMMTAYADIDLAVEAMRLGAVDFVQKAQIDIRELRVRISKALDHSNLKQEKEFYEEEARRMEPWELVGEDPSLQSVRETIDLAAKNSHCTVMIRGETGSGKELVAHAIHSRGPRKDKRFVALSISSLSAELVSAELFGSVRGAYTDAKEARTGYIEKAQGGVLFLDEIGELSQDVQKLLLRFLENRTFAKVGSTTEITVDIQIVCATNKNLEEAIAAKEFRADLYYRLQNMVIWLPPLRDRLSDVPLLADHFLFVERQNRRTRLAGFSPATLEILKNYQYPGNVRELKSIVLGLIIRADGHHHSLIEPDDFDNGIGKQEKADVSSPQVVLGEDGIDIDYVLAATELGYVQRALELTEKRKTEAWKLLGLNDRKALWRRVKRITEVYPDLLRRFPVVQDLYRDQ